jgi:hypothetical protein
MIERRVGTLSNDLLLQILDHQQQNALTLGQIKSDVTALAGPEGRVTKLENGATRNFWMSYVITPFLMIAHAVARNMGVRI